MSNREKEMKEKRRMELAIVLFTLCCVTSVNGGPGAGEKNRIGKEDAPSTTGPAAAPSEEDEFFESEGQRRNLARSQTIDPLECGCERYEPRPVLHRQCMQCWEKFSDDGTDFAGCLRDNDVTLDERARNYVATCDCKGYISQQAPYDQCMQCRSDYITDQLGFGGCLRKHDVQLSGSSQLVPPTGFSLLFAITLLIRFLGPLISSIKNTGSNVNPRQNMFDSHQKADLQSLYKKMLLDDEEESIPLSRMTAALQNLGMGKEGIEEITAGNQGNIDFRGFRNIMSKAISDGGVLGKLSEIAPMDGKGKKVLVKKLINLFSQTMMSQEEQQQAEELVNSKDQNRDGKLSDGELDNLAEELKHKAKILAD